MAKSASWANGRRAKTPRSPCLPRGKPVQRRGAPGTLAALDKTSTALNRSFILYYLLLVHLSILIKVKPNHPARCGGTMFTRAQLQLDHTFPGRWRGEDDGLTGNILKNAE